MLQQIPKQEIQMSTTPTGYVLSVKTNDNKVIAPLLKDYKEPLDDNKTHRTFTSFHMVITINKKIFLVQSIQNEIHFQQVTIFGDTVEKSIKTSINYNHLKDIVVPDSVKQNVK